MNKTDFHLKQTLKIFWIIGLFFFLSVGGYAQGDEKISIGHRTGMHSKILEKDIQLSVHAPDDYDRTEGRYPVLYTFQTHFAQVSGAVKNLYDYGLTPNIIVVSIDNYEYGYLSPTKIESDPNSGQADQFLQFFKEELFTFIDSKYRTHPYRIVFSNSWGAMFAVYAVLVKPDIFHAAIASVPWIPFDEENRFMINHVEKFLSSTDYHNILYMAMDNESVILPDLETFLGVLGKIPKQGLKWEYHYWPEEDHTSTPYRSLYSGLRTIFKGWNQIPPEIAFKGRTGIEEHIDSLNSWFGYDIGISPSALRTAGQEHQRNKNYEEAISIFKYAVDKRPNDAFVYVTLGRIYEECSMFPLAKESFQKAYDLALASSHPQVKWVKNFLDKIIQKMDQIKK
ncbi:MAG: alpha/beta hydrolase-fold protein [Candidatus Aminicenantes bacterium]|nr:alpha/beta hydrolase-fold protein [Candidatus Aminicenantes bacterium]